MRRTPAAAGIALSLTALPVSRPRDAVATAGPVPAPEKTRIPNP
jgi:hypothetical protein